MSKILIVEDEESIADIEGTFSFFSCIICIS